MTQYATQTGQEQRAEHMVSSIASPIPVGMIALAFATAIIGCAYAGFIIPSDRASTSLAVGAALFFGGIVQILAGMWEFRHDDTNPATIFTSYGGFLIAFQACYSSVH